MINQGDLKGAIDHYRKALQIDPRASGVHYELGEAVLESARADVGAQADAQRELESAITVEGDTAKVECELADIALLQSAPEQALAHYQLARAYQRLQMTELAEKELHLSQEIRKTKEQVEALYHQMNRYTKPETYEAPN